MISYDMLNIMAHVVSMWHHAKHDRGHGRGDGPGDHDDGRGHGDGLHDHDDGRVMVMVFMTR